MGGGLKPFDGALNIFFLFRDETFYILGANLAPKAAQPFHDEKVTILVESSKGILQKYTPSSYYLLFIAVRSEQRG